MTKTRTENDLTILIYDRKLERVSRDFDSFARSFKRRYAVDSGEALKDLSAFPEHVLKLSRLGIDVPARRMTVLAAGGGTVGDFAGFFASVYKRGVKLVHMPSTWLAALDSSHGGKTALNVNGVKNQIGTFYPSEKTIFDRGLLMSQPPERVQDAMGELAKIAMIDGGSWVKQLEASELQGGDLLWQFLKPAVDSKMRVVNRDPLEKTGARQILNLGHTLAHVLEAETSISHGDAVAQGLFFALEFSLSRGDLSEPAFERAMSLMAHLGLVPRLPKKKISAARLTTLLLQDKKRDQAKSVTFVFLKRFGKCERREVLVTALVREAQRQGWAK